MLILLVMLFTEKMKAHVQYQIVTKFYQKASNNVNFRPELAQSWQLPNTFMSSIDIYCPTCP